MNGSRATTRRPLFLRAVAASLIAALLIATPDPGAAQEQGETVLTEGAIAVERTGVSDAAIRDRIRAILKEISGFEDVTVSVSSGVVTLRGEVLNSAASEELARIVNRVDGVVAFENAVTRNADVGAQLNPVIARMKARLSEALALVPLMLVAVAAFAVIAGAGWTATRSDALWRRLAPNAFIAEIYRAIARVVFVIAGLVVALDVLNATALLGAVLGAAGVAGLALGFAVRDTVENFIASIMLSLRQPFRPNDFVDIDGDQGNVARLTSRATILITADGNHVRIPNATVFKGRIVNYTRNPERRFDFRLGVDADSDLAAALATATEAIAALPFVLTSPPVSAWIEEVGDSNVVLSFAGWVDQRSTDFLKGRGEAIRTAKTALEAAGFGLPEPIYRLRVEGAATPESAAPEPEPRPAPRRPAPAGSALPEAASPGNVDTAAEAAAEEERRARDAGSDLLSDARGTE